VPGRDRAAGEREDTNIVGVLDIVPPAVNSSVAMTVSVFDVGDVVTNCKCNVPDRQGRRWRRPGSRRR
jgi:hypothetical protein